MITDTKTTCGERYLLMAEEVYPQENKDGANGEWCRRLSGSGSEWYAIPCETLGEAFPVCFR